MEGNRTLRDVLRVMESQKQSRLDALREQVESSTVPLPADLVEQLSQTNPSDLSDVLMVHPGYPSWEALGSYKISLRVFKKALDDLIGVINQFEVLARDGKVLGRANEDTLDEFGIAVQKELFAAANAAYSLVDHSTRRLQTKLDIDSYEQKLSEHFGDDCLHDFIVCLRKIIHHVRMQEANWRITKNPRSDPEISAEFQLLKKDLLKYSREMNSSSRQYLDGAHEQINTREIFQEYGNRVSAFHSWLLDAIESTPLPELRDYERCLRENKKAANRTVWKAMLGNWLNWDKPPNPYEHLDRYLTKDQLDAVNRLPERSKKQVDKIIELVDSDGACDEELRGLLYRLFEAKAP